MEKNLFRRYWRMMGGILLIGILGFGYFHSVPSVWAASPGKAELFPPLAGWKGPGEIEIFSPDNLYNYINGAADLYLKYDFEELQTGEYQGPDKASITIELYRHRTPNNAFGIYSQERGPAAQYLPIGAQGYREEGMLIFIAGNYYVKINSANLKGKDAELLPPLGEKVARGVGSQGSLPPILSAFPEKGKKGNSEKFIAKNFLGYSFLSDGFTADYETYGKKFKLFIIEGNTPPRCREMLRQYLEKVGTPKAAPIEGTEVIADPYHGKIQLSWRGKYIWGVLGLDDGGLRAEYLGLLEKGIKQ
ncbi:MAG: hypothetical protein NTY64_20405 [Deltaproteobacteria bacterium]|nr:hypothetical protein [Deltaproteobacteria bacterium]